MDRVLQNSRTFHLVWGAGALGILLAWDLHQTASREFLLVGRSEKIATPTILIAGHKHRFATARAKYYSCTPSAPLSSRIKGAAQLVIYFCVPPNQTAQAVDQAQMVLRELNIPEVCFVFCQNGIVPSEHWLPLTHVLPSDTRVSVIRALVYLGAQRRREGERIEIEHRGGSQVLFGSLLNLPSGDLFPPATEIFVWKNSKDIKAEEICKFFVNFLLCLECGRNEKTNGEVLTDIDAERLIAYSRNFAAVANCAGALPEKLETVFHNTATATATNINSVTTAWLNGDISAWKNLCMTMQNMINSCNNSAAAAELLFLLDKMPAWNEAK